MTLTKQFRCFTALSLAIWFLLVGVSGPLAWGAPDKKMQTAPRLRGPRLALLIGNGQYITSPLAFPDDDVRVLGGALSRAGFEVEKHFNLDKGDLEAAVARFVRQVRERGASAAFVFYSGHGKSKNGKNYLVPILRAPLEEGANLDRVLVEAETVTSALNMSGCPITVLIFDACRVEEKSQGIGDSKFNGLTRMEAGEGSLIIFSSAPLKPAKDGVFAPSFASAIDTRRGESLYDVITYTTNEVFNETERYQRPYITGSLTQAFRFYESGKADDSPDRVPPVENRGNPGKIRIRINPKDGAEMVWVDAGEFVMGSNSGMSNARPAHKVRLDGYWIYKNLVTFKQYRVFCEDTSRSMPNAPNWNFDDDHPISGVNWHDASAYAEWAGCSLPSEAQWEKAARGTDGRLFPWGNTFNTNNLWSSVGVRRYGTAPVGSFPKGASAYGCLDMAGNLAQWCSDWYQYDAYGAFPTPNPTGPALGRVKVLRGGHWGNVTSRYFETIYRDNNGPSYRNRYNGFRCALAP